mgnify:CR=1 FL=1
MIGRRKNSPAPVSPTTEVKSILAGDSMSTRKVTSNSSQTEQNLGSNKQKLTASDNYQG